MTLPASLDTAAQLALLEGLLRHYSPTLAEAPAVDYLAGQMRALGYAVTIDETGSLIGSLGDGPREIVLLGHIDTVPGEIPVETVEGRLYGRGAVDAKGPLASFTAAAALCGPRPGWRLTVIGATGEEGDSRGAKGLRDHYRPDYCIIGEPSGWAQVTLGYKGSAWVAFTARRALAHTAAREQSASEAAVDFWNRLRAAQVQRNTGQPRAFEQLSASLRGMHSEQDGFYDTARLEINLRLPPGLPVADLMDWLMPLLAEGDELRLLDGIECYRADKNTPLVRAFLAAIRQEGGKPGFLVKTGTSDMNIVGPTWNCPILAYGPGDSTLDHTPHEHIYIEEYISAIKVLESTLIALMQ